MKAPSQVLFKLALLLSVLGAGVASPFSFADEISVAVTDNFDFTLEELKREFETQTGHLVTVIPGASAQHYARILDGVPFDIFLSEDSMRPEILENEELIIPGTRFTYARGRLVLWSVKNRPLTPKVLSDNDFQYLAIANPRLAPYGRAAKEFLEAMDLWEALQEKLVTGENIGQTYQFAISGDVDMALIAFSQIIYGNYLQAGSYWPVPENLYTPIELQGGLLKDSPAGKQFLQFISSAQGREIILSNGFFVP